MAGFQVAVGLGGVFERVGLTGGDFDRTLGDHFEQGVGNGQVNSLGLPLIALDSGRMGTRTMTLSIGHSVDALLGGIR